MQLPGLVGRGFILFVLGNHWATIWVWETCRGVSQFGVLDIPQGCCIITVIGHQHSELEECVTIGNIAKERGLLFFIASRTKEEGTKTYR